MFEEQIERIQQKLAELRRLDPQGSVLFGAHDHQYQLNPPASEELLQQFESRCRISLPAGYREFLLCVGNGGAGPYYGLYPLKAPDEANIWDEYEVGTGTFSSAPEYLAANWKESTRGPADDSFYMGMDTQSIGLGTQGCSVSTILVAEGEMCGQVWASDYEAMGDSSYGFWPETPIEVEDQILKRKGSGGPSFSSEKTGWRPITVYDINPFGTEGTQGPLFLDWYEHWLNAGLQFFAPDAM